MAVREAVAPRAGETTSECPSCGGPLAPEQLFCLTCGARVGLSYRKAPSWMLPVAVIAVVLVAAGAGLAFALNEISGDSERAASAPSPIETLETEQPPPAGPAESAQGEREAAQQPPAPASARGGGIAEWPKRTSAYTVVLLSADNRPGAEVRARDAIRRGIPAGVLHSDDYPSLNKGYWVVFAGEFDAEKEAQEKAAKYAAQGFPGGYARFVSAEK